MFGFEDKFFKKYVIKVPRKMGTFLFFRRKLENCVEN